MSDAAYTREDLEAALMRAHEAKDIQAANALADAIRALPAEEPKDPGFIDRLSKNYKEAVGTGLENMSTGADQFTGADSSAWERTKGIGNMALGALEYGASPVNAASKTIVGDPAKNAATMAGASPGVAQFIGDTADIGSQVFSGAPVAKAVQQIPALVEAGADTAKLILAATKKVPAMTGEQLRTASQNAYKASANAGVVINPLSFKAFVADLPKNIEDFHPTITPSAAPKAVSMINAMGEHAATGAPITLSELDSIRQAVGKAAVKNADPNEGRIMGEIRDNIDDYLDNLRQGDLSPFTSQADASKAVAELRAAQQLWRRSKKIEDIDDILSVGAALNDPRSVQNKFRAIRKNKRQFNRYSPDEKALINKIARTGVIEGAGRVVSPSGNDLTSSLRLLTGSGIGAVVGGAPGAVAVPALGMAARLGGDAVRTARIGALKETIARGNTPVPSFIERLRAQRALARQTP